MTTWCLGCRRSIRSGSYCRACRPRNGSTRPWRRMRAGVLARDGHRCRYCGEPAAHVDHVVPLARGGRDVESNLAASCAACNLAKGDRA